MSVFYATKTTPVNTGHHNRLALIWGLCLALFLPVLGWGQLSISTTNTVHTINFDATVSGVNNGLYTGAGFQATPTSGRLDSDAWAATGWSNGDLAFGGTQTTASTDYTRGTATAAVTTGGFYAFRVATSPDNWAFGIQPGSGDWEPGTLTLRIQNNSGVAITSLDLAYRLYTRNDQSRSSSFNFSYSTDNSSYTDVTSINYTSIAALVVSAPFTSDLRTHKITGISVANGDYIYIRWNGAAVGGSGSRDEFALDDISISANATTNFPEITGGTYESAIIGGNATIAASATMLLSSAASMTITSTGYLTVPSTTTANFNSRSVTIESTPTGTGSIGTIAGTVSNASNVTVQRYISAANNQAYRLLAPGVTTATSIRANWQENTNNTATAYASNSNPNPGYGTHITGSTDGSNGFDATTNGNLAGAKSLYTYTPGNPGSWTAVANTNVNTLSATTGYLLYVRGSRLVNLTQTNAQNITNATNGNTTLRATGTLQTGTINIPTSTADNFALVANPYAAPLRWDATTGAYSLANNSTNFENYVTIWDPNQSSRGAYVTITSTGTVSAGTLTQNLQTGQAFFVKVKTGVVGTPNFTVQESHKATSNSLDAFRVGAQQEMLRAGLFFTHTDNTRRQADGVVTVYDNNYSAAFDGNDAMQIANWDEDVAIVSNNKELSIETRPLADNGDTIFFNIARLREMNYEWEFTAENFNAPGLTAYVQDAFTNTETAISLSGTTVVPFTVTADAASKAANRFRVVYRTSGVLPVTLTSVKAYQQNNGITVAWNTQSESGMQQYEVEKSANGTSFTKVNTTAAKSGTSNSYSYFDATPINGANYYRIKAISLNGDVKYSTIVVVRLGDKGTTLSVYPNPVKGNTISLAFNGLTKGNYTVSLFNQLGQQVWNRVISHNGGVATQTIDLGTLSAGLYELRLSNGATVFTEKLIKE